MMKHHVLMLFIVLQNVAQMTSASCCENDEYLNFTNAVTCNFVCTHHSEESPSLCSSCITSETYFQQFYSSSNNYGFTRPSVVCQDLILEKAFSGKVSLIWTFENVDLSIFLVEARSSKFDYWSFINMTNETFISVKYLEIGNEYQFRVTPFMYPNWTLSSLTSDWITINGFLSETASFDLDITNFTFTGNFIRGLINWEPPSDMPCRYDIYCFSYSPEGHCSSGSIVLPRDTLPIQVHMKDFSSNYSIDVYPMDYNEVLSAPVARKTFTTPSCLSLTDGNFTICAPWPPRNFQMKIISDAKEVLLSWLPPNGTSPDNPVKKYFVSVASSTEDDLDYFPYQDFFTVDEDTLNTTVSHIKPSVIYVFQVSAISAGGNGLPATIHLYTNVTYVDVNMWDLIPWKYILLGVTSVFAISFIIFVSCLYLKRSKNREGYASGSADVPDSLRPYLLPSKKIELKFLVGKGEFGTVYKGFYSRNKDKELVAVKLIPAESVSRKKLLHEVEILQILGRHHNIVGLVGFSLDVDKMLLILEYCPLGNLLSWLHNFKKELVAIKRKMSESSEPLLQINERNEKYGIKLCSYIHQIATGMEYIASMKVVHRDLAARNILLSDANHIKIADFGLSKDVYTTQMYSSSKSRRLPLRWMAPEAIEENKFSSCTDVWSFGVVMWEIFKFGKIPYSGLSNTAVLSFLKEGYRLPKPRTSSQEWYDLMLECWNSIPSRRPCFKEIVKKVENILNDLSHYTILVEN